jgi:hypothetical protein
MRERGPMIAQVRLGLAGTLMVAAWLASWALLAYVFAG